MRTLCLAALAAILVPGCSSMADPDPESLGFETEEEYRADRAELVAELEVAIGDASASSEGACAVVAVGEKACGGPAAYRVYSESDGDPDRVVALAADVTALDKRAIAAFSLVSTCEALVPPTPVLVGGQCTDGR